MSQNIITDGADVTNLIERERELAAIHGALDRAADGGGSLLFIEGEAGIGKSRLVRAACEAAARRNFRVLSVVAHRAESDLPFAIVRHLFDRIVSSMPPDQRAALFEGPARAAESVLRPVAGRDDGGAPAPGTAAHHGLYWLTANLSGAQPLLIAVDQVHCCDLPSLRFLRYLGRRLAELPIVVVVTSDGDGGTDGSTLLELAAAATTVLTPQPLGVDGARRLLELRGQAVPEALAGLAHELTAGNPFLLTELGKVLDPDLSPAAARALAPPGVVRSVRLRLRRLGGTADSLAHALAILGEGTDLRLLASYLGIDLEAAFTAATDLSRAAVLTDDGTPRFRHPVVGAAILADLPQAERAAMHRRAARLLLAERADHERVARHLMATPPLGDPDVVHSLRAAATQARDRGAVAAAVRYLTRAVQEPPRAEDRGLVLAELGVTEMMAADVGAAVEHLRDSYRLAATAHERAERALPLARAEVAAGSVTAAVRVLEDAAAGLAPADRELALRLGGELAYLRRRPPRQPADEELVIWAARYGGETPGERVLLANLALRELHGGRVPASSVAAVARRALGNPELGDRALLQDLGADNPIYYLPGTCLAFADQPHEAAASFALAHTEAQARRSRLGECLANVHLAITAWQHGAVPAAEAFGRSAWQAALELDASAGSAEVISQAAAGYAAALVESGATTEALNVLAHASSVLEPVDAAEEATATVHYARGLCHAAAGRGEEARQDLTLAVELAAESDGWHPGRPWRAELALVLAELGKHDEAVDLAESQLAGARRWGTPSTIGSALRVLAEVDPAAPLSRLEQAVEILRPAPAKLELARAMVALGTTLDVADHHARRLGLLREAHDLAHRCGARTLERRADAALRELGARPRQPTYTGVQALTVGERRVVEHAARGATNRQIAQALFVTTKTVESHLAAAFRKLAISSRASLSKILAREASNADPGGTYSPYDYCSVCRTPLSAVLEGTQ